MKLSRFGQKLTSQSGIVNLMEDLGQALNVNPELLFLGGGNPARIPAFEAEVATHLTAIAQNPDGIHKLVGVYQSPKGSEVFIDALVTYIRKNLGWNITAANVATTNGSQSAFFILLNILAGRQDGSSAKKKVVFPMMPEYLGYSDQSSEENMFRSFLPHIEYTSATRFKYRVDFNALALGDQDAALCVSRPTNPTGNVLTNDELDLLSQIAKQQGIPFIIDCAYGDPFPGMVYNQEHVNFSPDNIYVISCSKLGMPGVRTGIVVGPQHIIEKVVNVNTVMSLANGNLGPSLMTSLINNGDLAGLCQNTLQPFYRSRRDFAVACVEKHFAGLPYLLHEPEGAFFLWLWFPELSISSSDLYERMKDKGVLIMDGSHFFFGIDDDWPHAHQCIRLTYCQSENVIKEGIRLLAEEIKGL